MAEKKTFQPSNYRIISIRQRRRILHVEDCLDIGKIHFDLYAFSQGQGSQAQAEAYLDHHTARLLFKELAAGRLCLTNKLRIHGGGNTNSKVTARILMPEMADGTENPIRIDITNGPGIRQSSGLISPHKWDKNREQVTRLQILLSESDAVTLGLAGLEHLQAWATNTYRQRLDEQSYTPQPDVDPLTGQVVDALTGEINEVEPELRYGNDEPVGDNEQERLAFEAYLKSEARVPESLESLRAWYKVIQKHQA
jgi:hypothetical protein